MQGFAGVVVLGDNSVLVNEPDYFTGEPRWTFPSGHVEQGEDPAKTAARELAEESGCIRFLTSGERNLHWTFDLIDASTPAPTFRWDPPAPRSPE